MVKRIKINLDVVERILYYWHATSEREKVGEIYLNDLAGMPSMKYIYDDIFDAEAVRRVLSAISNKEKLSSESKKESRFWNYNMWMLEDLDFTDKMVNPIKTLNLDFMVEELKNVENNKNFEEIEVVFLPGHLDDYLIKDNKLIINLFRVRPSENEDNKTFLGEKEFIEFIREKLQELLNG